MISFMRRIDIISFPTVRCCPEELKYASEALRADRDIVMAVVKENGFALPYASEALRTDKDIVLAAVNQNGMALEYVSDEFRANEEIVLEALQQNLKAIRYSKLGDKTNKRLLNKVRLMSKFVKPEAFGFDDFLQEDNNRLNKDLLLTNKYVVDYLGYSDLPGLFVNKHAKDVYLPTAQKITSELSND